MPRPTCCACSACIAASPGPKTASAAPHGTAPFTCGPSTPFQGLFHATIRAGGYDTSYRALARRAARADNAFNRLVRRGSAARRVCMFGEPGALLAGEIRRPQVPRVTHRA